MSRGSSTKRATFGWLSAGNFQNFQNFLWPIRNSWSRRIHLSWLEYGLVVHMHFPLYSHFLYSGDATHLSQNYNISIHLRCNFNGLDPTRTLIGPTRPYSFPMAFHLSPEPGTPGGGGMDEEGFCPEGPQSKDQLNCIFAGQLNSNNRISKRKTSLLFF